MGSACGTCTNQKTFSSFIDGDSSIRNQVSAKRFGINCENDEFSHSFIIKDGITQFPIGKEEVTPEVRVNMIQSDMSPYWEVEYSENTCSWDNTYKRLEDNLKCTGARPSVKWSSDSTEVITMLTPQSFENQPSKESSKDTLRFAYPKCPNRGSFETTSVPKEIKGEVHPLRCIAKDNLASTGQGNNEDANAHDMLLDLNISGRNEGKEENMISSQDSSRYQVASGAETEFRNSGGEVYGIMCTDLCWLREDDGNDPTDWKEKMCVAEPLKNLVSISPALGCIIPQY